MASSEVERLRRLVKKRRADVLAKEARIRRNTGIDIKGTREDPTRPRDVINKYNAQQLRAYYRDLDAFMSRSNNYVAGVGGVPLPKALYREYKKLENRFNATGDKKFEEMADIFLPTHGVTIRQREEMLKPSIPTAGGENTTHPYTRINKQPKNITSVNALKTLIADMNKRLKGGYNVAKIAEQRQEANDALDRLGMAHFKERFANLTNQQFDMLWNYAKIGNKIYDMYHIMSMMSGRSSDSRWYDSVVEDNSNELGELFDWAESISPETVNPRSKNNSQNSGTRRNRKA